MTPCLVWSHLDAFSRTNSMVRLERSSMAISSADMYTAGLSVRLSIQYSLDPCQHKCRDGDSSVCGSRLESLYALHKLLKF